MNSYLLALVLAALAAAPNPTGARRESREIPPLLSPVESEPDDNTIAFVDGVIPGLVCPMHAGDICGKVALAPAGWWGRGAGHHIMIDVTYGCLAGCTWLVRESVSQPEPESPPAFQRLPPRAQRAGILPARSIRPECVFTLSPSSINVPATASASSVTVIAEKVH